MVSTANLRTLTIINPNNRRIKIKNTQNISIQFNKIMKNSSSMDNIPRSYTKTKTSVSRSNTSISTSKLRESPKLKISKGFI